MHISKAFDVLFRVHLRKTIHSVGWIICNDPSAGSPTETLLRLLLPLNVKVYSTFRKERRNCKPRSPKYSPEHSIGRLSLIHI